MAKKTVEKPVLKQETHLGCGLAGLFAGAFAVLMVWLLLWTWTKPSKATATPLPTDIATTVQPTATGTLAPTATAVVTPTAVITTTSVITPTTIPTVASATLVAATDPCLMSWQPGEVRQVPANCRVSGDVAVAASEGGPFTALYDSDADSGLLISTKTAIWVKAPWGASANSWSTDQWTDAMRTSGCAGKCKTVTVLACEVKDGKAICAKP